MSDAPRFVSASARAPTPTKQAALRLRGGRRTSLVRCRSLDFHVLLQRIAEKVDVVAMMTQDAVLADERPLETLLAAFDDDSVAAAYGRQLPHANADPFAAHARLFNYLKFLR